MSGENGLTRRQFLERAAVGAAGAAAVATAPGLLAAGAPSRARVVLVRDRGALDADGRLRPAVVQRMLDEAVVALTGATGTAAAWRTLVGPHDVVGIKSNAWRYLPTPPAIEEAIRRRVLEVGVAPGDVAVDDRGVLANPVFRRATALVNTRPLRSHHWAGVGSLIKNYIMFAPSPPDYHPDSCADLARLWELPAVKGKTRLNVLVLLTPQFHGVGPHGFSPQYVWPYAGLAVGIDPVAVDAVGLRILEAKRREHFGEDRPLSPPAKHIPIAETRHGLGIADPARIDVVRLGESEGALI